MAQMCETAAGFFGDKLYQRRARIILPILVRQAKAGMPIYYEDLAEEVGMPNPRNLNYPLGCIGDVLIHLESEWGSAVPHIQAMVRNKNTGLPGPGFDGFITEQGKKWSTTAERRAIIEGYWAEIAAYPYWDDVLEALNLQPTMAPLIQLLDVAARGGGGEGADHLELKMRICGDSYLVGLEWNATPGIPEYLLPSGDSIDVLFDRPARIYAVEVKPILAQPSDIVRGLFQCVKYLAVLRAKAAYENDRRTIGVCLAIGGHFPEELVPLRNALGVRVIDGLQIS